MSADQWATLQNWQLVVSITLLVLLGVYYLIRWIGGKL